MKQLTMSVLISSLLASSASFAGLEPLSDQTMSPGKEYSWLHQFGSDKVDSANAIATFDASVYVVGGVEIDGAFFGGNSNGFLQRYDLWGNLVSEAPFGEPQKSEANAVFADETGVYVAGNTTTAPANHLNPDILIVKYDHVGNTIWRQQFGQGGPDYASGITADGTGIYLAGSFGAGHSGFIYKYDRNGNKMWSQEIRQEKGDFFDSAFGQRITTSKAIELSNNWFFATSHG